jgi:hypothetical protein
MRSLINHKKRHDELWAVCDIKRKDFKGWSDMGKSDCSCGCYYFYALDGIAGADWRVCFNTKSPRCGKLTFEHMGCDYFKWDKKWNKKWNKKWDKI